MKGVFEMGPFICTEEVPNPPPSSRRFAILESINKYNIGENDIKNLTVKYMEFDLQGHDYNVAFYRFGRLLNENNL